MLYTPVESSNAPRAEPVPGVLEYFYNNGGLNNQRMALLGLLLTALRDDAPVRLPYLHLKNHQATEETVTEFGTIFDLDRVLGFASASGLRILDGAPGGDSRGWDYFGGFSQFLHHPASLAAFRIALDAIACLRARLADHPDVLALKAFLFASLGIDTVVQLRIESDWQYHYQHGIRPVHGDRGDNNAGFGRIITKVKNTFPDLRAVLTTADEDSMPAGKDEIRAACRRQFQIELFWKTDFLPQSFLARLTPFDRSLIDFELAVASPRFVGITLSTFANMAATHKMALTRKPVRGHYIYNTEAETVLERRDNGLVPLGRDVLEPNATDTLLTAEA